MLNGPLASPLEPLVRSRPARAPWQPGLRSSPPGSPCSLKAQEAALIQLNQESAKRQERRAFPTFTHVTDLLLEHVVAVFIHVGPQEVLEAVVDLEPGRHHGHPLPDSVALRSQETGSLPMCSSHIAEMHHSSGGGSNLHVLQVLDALDHVFLFVCNALGCPLGQTPPSGCRPLVILVFAV